MYGGVGGGLMYIYFTCDMCIVRQVPNSWKGTVLGKSYGHENGGYNPNNDRHHKTLNPLGLHHPNVYREVECAFNVDGTVSKPAIRLDSNLQ